MSDDQTPSALFHGTGRFIQFAQDGDWRKARVCTNKDEAAHLKVWLNQASTNNIALEINFEDAAGQDVFFGIRLAGVTKRRELCLQALEYFGEPSLRSIQDFLRHPHSPFATFPFMRDPPELLELSPVHDWRSLPPLKFWKKADKPSPEEGLRTALGANTNYRDQLFDQPLAIELAYQLPVPHWLSVVVSKQYRGKYRINLPAAVALCQKVSQKAVLV